MTVSISLLLSSLLAYIQDSNYQCNLKFCLLRPSAVAGQDKKTFMRSHAPVTKQMLQIIPLIKAQASAVNPSQITHVWCMKRYNIML